MKNHWKPLLWAIILIIPMACAVCEKQMPIEEYKKIRIDTNYHSKTMFAKYEELVK